MENNMTKIDQLLNAKIVYRISGNTFCKYNIFKTIDNDIYIEPCVKGEIPRKNNNVEEIEHNYFTSIYEAIEHKIKEYRADMNTIKDHINSEFKMCDEILSHIDALAQLYNNSK